MQQLKEHNLEPGKVSVLQQEQVSLLGTSNHVSFATGLIHIFRLQVFMPVGSSQRSLVSKK